MSRFAAAPAFALALAIAAAAPLAAETAIDPALEAAIADRAALERDVRELSDDAMEGRGAGTQGYARAAGYVAGRFAALGLAPAGDAGTYYQAVPLLHYGEDEDTLLTFRRGDEIIEPRSHVDFYGSGSAQLESGLIEAPLVFVGYALDDLDSVDLEGAIAVRAFGTSGELDTEEAAHLRSAANQRLSERGAVGTMLLWTPTLENLLAWEQVLPSARGVSAMTWIDAAGAAYSPAPGLQVSATLSPSLSRLLLYGQDFDYDDLVAAEASGAAVPVFDLNMVAQVQYASYFEAVETSNVIAILPGTDPALADQYIVLTAHLDHQGRAPTPDAGDDEIYNGAMDNATGVASMMEVARLLRANPPRRPVMFIALAAEEHGLVGSSYNALNPTVPAGQLAVNLNIDMPILTYPFSDVNAFGAERSNVYSAVAAAVAEAGLTLSPDPDPAQGLFVRSDQYSYVRQGIPAIYLKTGFAGPGAAAQRAFREQHYHQVSDEADLIDFEQLGRFAEVNYLIARNVANMDARPAWNAGDFFGAAFGTPENDYARVAQLAAVAPQPDE